MTVSNGGDCSFSVARRYRGPTVELHGKPGGGPVGVDPRSHPSNIRQVGVREVVVRLQCPTTSHRTRYHCRDHPGAVGACQERASPAAAVDGPDPSVRADVDRGYTWIVDICPQWPSTPGRNHSGGPAGGAQRTGPSLPDRPGESRCGEPAGRTAVGNPMDGRREAEHRTTSSTGRQHRPLGPPGRRGHNVVNSERHGGSSREPGSRSSGFLSRPHTVAHILTRWGRRLRRPHHRDVDGPVGKA